MNGIGERVSRGTSPRMAALCLVSVAGLVLALSTQRWPFVLAVGALPAVAAVLSADLRTSSKGVRAGIVVPAFIAAMPLLSGFSPGFGGSYVSGAAVLAAVAWVLLLMYVGASAAPERAAFGRRARVLAIPLAGLVLATAAAQLATGEALQPVVQMTRTFSLYSLVAMVGFYLLACLYCNSRERIERLMWWCLIVNVVQVPVVLEQRFGAVGGGVVQSLLGVQPAGNYAYGILQDGELTSELLVLLWAWSLCFTIWGRSRRRRNAAGVLAAVYLVGALTMTHRSALLGTIGITLLVLALVAFGGAKGRAKGGLAFVLLGVALVVFASGSLLSSLPSAAVGRLTSDAGLSELSSAGGNFGNRQPLFAAAFDAAAKDMPVTGYGIDHVEPLHGRAGVNANLGSTHSLWLWSLLSAGVAGLAFAVLLFFRLLVCSFRSWFANRTGVSVALLASVVFLFVDESKVEAVRSPVYAFFMFAFFGVVASYARVAQLESKALRRQR